MPGTSRDRRSTLNPKANAMTSTLMLILAILSHTPIWVWAIFAFVAFMGYQRTRDRTVELWRLLILPVVMVILSATGLVSTMTATTLPAILLGLAAGGTAGWLLEREGATVRQADGRVWLRGEWWSLAQVMLIFVVHYVSAVTAAVNPSLGADPVWQIATSLMSAALSAMVVGRVVARLRAYFRSAPAARTAA